MDQLLWERFERGAERKGTGCEKWDGVEKVFGRDDVLPMWVADMDFMAPLPVVDALAARAQAGVFGYACHDVEGDDAIVTWMKTRHGLNIDASWIRYSPGVVPSMLYGLRAMCALGDKVAIFTPVYGPFYRMTKQAGMKLVRCPLRLTDEGYRMDLALLESQFQDGVRALLLCSPHNPIGRIWTMEELTALVQLCNRYDVSIISDEIHMDFEMPGHCHTPILSVPGADRAIMLTSATKTFNLAALRHSTILIKDEEVRAQVDQAMADCGCGESNVFGELAQKVAYREGAEWLDGLIEYVDGNRRYVRQYLAKKLPEITCADLQGTYLLWLDFRALGMDAAALKQFLVMDAGVALNSGTDFGEEGAGFARMNLATPRRNVAESLARIEQAVRAR